MPTVIAVASIGACLLFALNRSITYYAEFPFIPRWDATVGWAIAFAYVFIS